MPRPVTIHVDPEKLLRGIHREIRAMRARLTQAGKARLGVAIEPESGGDGN